ncbi:glycosyltransferase family 2 protein [Algoriphagus zhangzhouensis]|uniref:Glycosyltransferase involved in cell wall bisynthesis n=1 Tax=Algoriphagus zhangzhouensis TaxID=1073327 RepID=A0A1M7ZHU1_9BACT|nr:glycosyltransferase family 2 protein [Algoriphagus zhangzhouensis]TDY44249.1 glycosyltransferase involved in cell wall biosynthesis [Algoriphagus zhangzhouensis]SHO64447.1 Glycosyltransferase involved in cell wall bisynthesis [Algoriphagus zhangzhouensis]
MLVSVITPVHNAGEHIEETIESVLKQTFQDWEMILIDDKSTDSSLKIIEKYLAQDSRIRLIKNSKNQGAAVTRNNGIEAAQGRYIAFLDSDDLWLPTKLEKQLAFMKKHGYAFTYTAYEKLKDGQIIGVQEVGERVNHNDLLKTCSIGCLTVIYDTQKLGKMLMPIISRRQDFALWLKILKEIPFAYGLNEVLSTYRLRSDSISGNKFKAAKYQWRVYREFEHLNLFEASYYFLQYSVFGVLKTYFHKEKK